MTTAPENRPLPPQPKGLKTWSALAHTKRRPSEYEIVTYGLQYRMRNPEAPYELDPEIMMNRWYKKNVIASPLKHPDWNRFRDPDQLTYRAYMTLQDGNEEYVDGLLRDHARRQHDRGLSPKWLSSLATLYTPQRYVNAALQMAGAYVVQMAPSSTITNCAAFQEADATRWMSRVAYRTRELANAHPDLGFATNEREIWEQHAAWQGIRELLERVLTTYDWGENVIALNVVAIRAIEETCQRQLAHAARLNGDTLTSMLLDAQLTDAERSRRWTTALVALALEESGTTEAISQWVGKWTPLADEAIAAYCACLPGVPDATAAAKQAVRDFRNSIGIA